jgi:hypothetical protein
VPHSSAGGQTISVRFIGPALQVGKQRIVIRTNVADENDVAETIASAEATFLDVGRILERQILSPFT